MQSKFVLAGTLAAVALVCAPQALAQDDAQLQADLRCATLGLAIIGSPETTPEQKQGGALISSYYIGRVQGRSPSINLEDAIYDTTVNTTPEQGEQDRQRCSAEFQARGWRAAELVGALQDRIHRIVAQAEVVADLVNQHV
jgi:hypothetical protein